MKLNELLQAIEVKQIVGSTDREITGIQFDSRRVEPGNLFVAQAGTAVDGHTFIASCVEKGASAVVLSNTDYLPATTNGTTYVLVENTDHALGLLASRWFGEPGKHLTLVGVTGTNG